MILGVTEPVAVINLCATIVLAMLTGLYVALTHRLVRAAVDPCVVVRLQYDPGRESLVLIVIENVGHGVARDITFTISDDIPKHAFGINEATAALAEKMTDGPLFEGIPALAPRERLTIIWGQHGGLKKFLGDRAIKVTCRFRSNTKSELLQAESDSVECVLNLRSYMYEPCGDTDGARQSAKHLEKIARVMEHSASGFRPIRVIHVAPESPPGSPSSDS